MIETVKRLTFFLFSQKLHNETESKLSEVTISPVDQCRFYSSTKRYFFKFQEEYSKNLTHFFKVFSASAFTQNNLACPVHSKIDCVM